MNDLNDNQEFQPKKVSNNSLKYYFCEIDWALSRFIYFIFNSLIFLFLISIGLLSIGFELYEIFEYREGFADISIIEVVFAISVTALFLRYKSYSKQTSRHWWDVLTTPFICYGKLITIFWLVISLLAINDLNNNSDDYKTFIIHGQNYIQLLDFIFILISLYISVPSKKLRIKKDKTTIPQSEQIKTETENA